MSIKRIGATAVVAIGVSLPLAACGSSPAPSVTTVTATTYPTYSSPCPLGDGFDRCIDTRRAERQAADAARPSARPSSNPAQSKHDGGGLPWWAWALILPGGVIALLVLAYKLLESADERTISRAQARVAELDARPRPVLDYDDYEDDDEDDDELPEADMDFLHRATDPTPSTSVQPVQPAAGNLLSSLRQQAGAQ